MQRIGDVAFAWGESLRWDDRRQRLYCVDCSAQKLHWLDHGEPPLHALQLPALPTGLALTEGHEVVVCLGDGLYVVDPDLGTSRVLALYPEGMHGRANGANADGSGNLVTGTLNMAPGPGGAWWYSSAQGWRLLDDDIGNANGPVVMDLEGVSTLVLADTIQGVVYAYPYDGEHGTVGERRVLSDHASLDGAPDGAAADAGGGIWSCVLRSGKLARLTATGLDRVVGVPMANPSDVAFGGPSLTRLFVTSIAFDLGEGVVPAPEAGWLIALDDLGVGQPEHRFHLD